MDREVLIRNLEVVAEVVMEVDPKTTPATECIRKLQESVVDLCAVMIGAVRNGNGAPADAGAPPANEPAPSSSERPESVPSAG